MRRPKSIGGDQQHLKPTETSGGTRIEMEIAGLAALDLEALRALWLKRFRKPAPGIQSRDILLRLFAARIQEAAFGALPKDTLKALLRAAQEIASEGRARIVKEPMPPPGSMLSRDWRGTVHTVTVLETGFAYQGSVFATLSRIVRQITGTHSSGPAFFGLRPKKSASRAARTSAQQPASEIGKQDVDGPKALDCGIALPSSGSFDAGDRILDQQDCDLRKDLPQLGAPTP